MIRQKIKFTEEMTVKRNSGLKRLSIHHNKLEKDGVPDTY